jgi:SAM-dependent methyltransferase
MTPELAADCYVALHRGTRGDVEYYVRACSGAARVLELGCGAGRVTLPVSRVCGRVVGVELDSGMLGKARLAQAQANATNVRWVEGDMCRPRVRGRFDRVLIPYSGLWCLPGVQAQRQCLQRARSLLHDTGELLLDVYRADQLGSGRDLDEPDIEPFGFVVELPVRAKRYRVFEQSAWWPSQRRLSVEYEFRPTPARAGGRMLTRVDHHYLFAAELEELMLAVGFRDLRWGIRGRATRPVRAEQLFLRAARG